MSFNLPYLCNGRHRRKIQIPDYYLGFVSSEDVNQLRFGLCQKTQNEPSISRVKNSVINLAKQRKENKRG